MYESIDEARLVAFVTRASESFIRKAALFLHVLLDLPLPNEVPFYLYVSLVDTYTCYH